MQEDASLLLELFSQNTSIIIPLMGIINLCLVTASGRSICSKPHPGYPGGVRADPSRCKALEEVLDLYYKVVYNVQVIFSLLECNPRRRKVMSSSLLRDVSVFFSGM